MSTLIKTRKTYRVCDSKNDPTFWTMDDLKKLLESQIANKNKIGDFQCDICDFVTHQKSRLTHHLTSHGIGKRHKCPECQKDFGQKGDLNYHIRTQHGTEDKRVQCHICLKYYVDKKHLNSHIHDYHRDIQVECTDCPKTFCSKGALTRHMKQTHENSQMWRMSKEVQNSARCRKTY